jgi:hypothetical protein
MSTEKPKLTRDELVALLRDHISVRVNIGSEYVYGGMGQRIRVDLIAHGTINENEVIISSDYAELPTP